MARLAAAKPDVLHVQWLGAVGGGPLALPAAVARAVFTAHDIVPRRTRVEDRPLAHALRPLSTASSCTRSGDGGQLVEFGVPGERLRVIPHPAFRSEVDPSGRRPDGALPRADPSVQGHGGRGRGGARRRRRAAARRRRPARAARRPPADRGRPRRVATRVPSRAGAPARALRRDGRPLPVPGGDRRLGRAAPGARGRACRRSSTTSAASARWSGASARARSSPPGDVGGDDRCAPNAPRTTPTRSRPPARARNGRATSSPGTPRPPHTSTLYRELA